MAEIAGFPTEGLVTSTLDRVILHKVVHHSSTSTYMPNFSEIEETFCGWTDVCTYVRTALLGQLCRRVNLKTIIRSQLSALFHSNFMQFYFNNIDYNEYNKVLH